MFNYEHYVPILRSKEAEFGALMMLEAEAKKKVSPYFHVTEIPKQSKNKKEPKKPKRQITIEEYLKKIGSKINTLIGHKAVFVDLIDVDGISYGDVDQRIILEFFQNIKKVGINVIPACGIHLLEPYKKIIEVVCKTTGTGICLRIEADDMKDVISVKDGIDRLLKLTNVPIDRCDLLVDMKELKKSYVGSVDEVLSMLNKIPYIDKSRTFILASSSFPKNFNKGDSAADRNDIALWKEIKNQRKQLERMPTYGDYGIQNPNWKVSSEFVRSAVNLRYACDDRWLLFKGRLLKKGDGQFNGLCKKILRSDEYKGANVSWADRYITDCVNGIEGSGNGTTWRKIGFNRHMTITVKQIT